ncbi:unnamed protein product, partial [Mesorhabditis spiculigera]
MGGHSSALRRHFAKISFKRKSANRDKIRTFRDLISTWPLEDAESLFREMDAMRQIAELYEAANAARPSVSTIGEQLLGSKTQAMELVFKGETLKVHGRLLKVRSEFIAEAVSEGTTVIELSSPLHTVTVDELREFIRFIYTDSCNLNPDTLHIIKGILKVKNPLAVDLQKLQEAAEREGDFVIALQRGKPGKKSQQDEYTLRLDAEIIAARSELFASLVKRRNGEKVIIPGAASSASSLSEARAMVSGQSTDSALQQAGHLLHIARFFGLHHLVQLCEDVIVASLSVDSCASILDWAADGGSHYVANMARAYLASEFSRLASTHHLFYLGIDQLEQVVGNHFLQSTEVEVLEAAIRWGEHELLKRMESREPNIVADTSHSISRRGIRKSEESERELREILLPICGHIRTDYILPPFHQSLIGAYGRGLVERSPLKDLVVCASTAEINPDLHWFCPDPQASGPRFYRAYFEVLRNHIISFTEAGSPGPSSRYPTVRSSGSAGAAPIKIIVVNSLPGVISDEQFRETKQKILDAVEAADSKYALRFMPRPFHKRLAVEMVVTRTLRELEVHPESVEVHIAEWAESQVGFRLNFHNLGLNLVELEHPPAAAQQPTGPPLAGHYDAGTEEKGDYLFKVCILGDAAVGKSSMISQYVDRTFAEDQKSTIGIDYRVKSATVDGKVVKLQIWDTAGQERFRPFRTNHLRAADGIIVVYSITDKKSFDAIPGWLAEVKDEGRRPRVLLIGNKLDREEEREVSLETVKAFADANCLEHLETSAKTDANIVEPMSRAAWELGSEVPVAIKVAHATALDQEQMNEVMKEAKRMRNCSHRNVVRMRGVAHEEEPLSW